MTSQGLAACIQHTNVSPTATRADILHLCNEALEFRFNGVMVQPCWIALCRECLSGSEIRVCSSFAYPMGGSLTSSKVAEMRDLVAAGVDEIDFMPNLGLLVSGEDTAFAAEIAEVVEAAAGHVVKAMLELEPLNVAQRSRAIALAEQGGCTYVKNSSGWGVGGKATVDLIAFMKSQVTRAKVKASGGVRDLAQAHAILAAGASLLGTSAGPAIMRGEFAAVGY
jgi:deoxyribose-phosphate aldolase